MKFSNNYFSLKVIFCLLFLLTGSLLFGAKKKTETVKVPDWISVPANVYPSDNYFSSVGYGPDRDAAELKAVNGIASIFGQSVKSEVQASKSMLQAEQNGKIVTAKASGFNQTILKTINADDLIGVEVKEFWFDNKETWYAIAIINKSKTAEILESMIRRNSVTVSELLINIEESDPSLEAFSTLDLAYGIAQKDEIYLNRLFVINPDKALAVKSMCVPSKKIAAKKTEVAKNITMYVAFEGDIDGRIENAYVSEISKYGFISSFDKKSRYVVTGVITFEESKSSDKKSTKCRYNLDSFIFDQKTGNQLFPFEVNGREGHVSYEEAMERSIKAMEKKIHNGFADAMKDYLQTFIVE